MDGPWAHSYQIVMSDEHRGRLVYCLEHEDGGPIYLDADIMLDHDLRIAHFYDPVYVNFKSMCCGGWGEQDECKSGIRAVNRALTRFPYPDRHSLRSLLARFAHILLEDGWRFGLGFDAHHCQDIRRRQHATAVRGGLLTLLPDHLLRTITDYNVTWAVPVPASLPHSCMTRLSPDRSATEDLRIVWHRQGQGL